MVQSNRNGRRAPGPTDQEVLERWIQWVLDRWVLEIVARDGTIDRHLFYATWNQWIWFYPLPQSMEEFAKMVLNQLQTFDSAETAWGEARRIDPLLNEEADRQDPTGEKFWAHLPDLPLMIDDINVIQVRDILVMQRSCQCDYCRGREA